MSLHAFVDESRRNSTYLLAAALVEPRHLAPMRKLLMALRMPNQRELHFKKETPARRRLIVSRLLETEVYTDLYVACCRRSEEKARQACVSRLTDDLVDVGAHRLVFDSREVRDRHDQLTIRLALGKRARETGLVYEHVASENDPLLWIPDIVAWCFGAGDDWMRRIKPSVRNVIDLRRI